MLPLSLKKKIEKPLRDNERLLILCVAEFVFMMGAGIVTPVLPRFAQSFGINAATVGFVIAVFGLARALTNTPAGLLSQRYGRRTLLIGGSLIAVAGSLLSGFAGDVWQLALCRFLTGIGAAAFTTGAMIYLTDISTPANRGRMRSVYQGSLLMGTSVGPAVGGFVAAVFDDRAPFLVVAVLSLACSLWCVLRLPETAAGRRRATERFETGQDSVNLKDSNLWSILLNGNFLLIGFVNFAIFFTRTGAEQSVVPLMAYNTLGIDSVALGFGMTTIAALNFLGTPLSGMAADRLGRKATIVPGLMLAGVGLLMFLISHNYAVFVLAAAVTGFGKGISGPAPAAYVADLAPKGREGITMGLYRTIADLGYVLGPVLLGWIVDSTGFGLAMWFSAFLLFASALLFAGLARETLSRSRAAKPDPEIISPRNHSR